MRGAVIAALVLVAAPACAADLPTKKSPAAPPAAAAFSWTGGYLGVEGGYGWVGETQTFLSTDGFAVDPAGTNYKTNRAGLLGGFNAGYNYQIGQFVLGAQGNFDFTGAKGASSTDSVLFPGLGVGVHEQGKTDWYATLTGRAGLALDSALLYAKGGAAWSQQQYGGEVTVVGASPTVYPNFSDVRLGWTIGAGGEYAFTRNVSAFAEFDYLNFGSKTYHVTSLDGVNTNYSAKTDAELVKIGLNYRF